MTKICGNLVFIAPRGTFSGLPLAGCWTAG